MRLKLIRYSGIQSGFLSQWGIKVKNLKFELFSWSAQNSRVEWEKSLLLFALCGMAARFIFFKTKESCPFWEVKI